MSEVQRAYDAVAVEYAREFHNELAHKPFDRKMLDWLIEKVAGAGPICDLGCGPGQIARYLDRNGAAACGIDLSLEMVKQAQRLNPAIPFHQGDMLRLANIEDGAFGGIAAFYSILHIAPHDLPQALAELHRVLRPEGVLLLTFHIGQEVLHKDEWWDRPVSLDFIFYETAAMKAHLEGAGFRLEEAIERDPYPGVEYPSRRAYLFARRPATSLSTR